MLVLYESNTIDFNNLGIGVLRDLKSDPLTTEVLNGLFNLEFDYCKNGWLCEQLVEGNIIKADGQLFRIRSVGKNIKDGNIKVFAKHIWFDNELNNWIEDTAPTDKVAQSALQWVLEHSKESNRFTINGDCTKVASARYVRMNPIEATYKADNSLLSVFGGELELNNFNIFVHNKRGSDNGIQIRQEKNLTGANFNVDMSTLTTRIMPIGRDGILLPEKYVDSPFISNYYAPFYYKLEVDVGVDEDEGIALDDCYVKMRAAAQNLFNSGIDKPSVNVSIDFIELSKTTEYSKYSSLETAHLGDTCKVYIPGLNLNLITRIVKVVKNITKNRIISVELGTPKINYVNSNNNIQNNFKNTISKLPDSILKTAQNNATNLINHPFEGYLYISENTGELYIMDTNDISTATNIWKFGLGGIGFSSSGINGPYTIAITQDGQIVADFITAGTLNSNVILGLRTINNGLYINDYGKVTMNDAVIHGGNIELIDTGNGSDPTIEIYDETAIASSTIKIGDKLSGKTLDFLWPTSGTNLTNIGTRGWKDIIRSSGGYTINGGWTEDHNVADEVYYLYDSNNTRVETLYLAVDYDDTLENFQILTSLSSYTLPDDFGIVNYVLNTDDVYDLINTPNIKKKTTKFTSEGTSVIDRDNNIDANYGSHGLSITDVYGTKYFNENGLLYMTNYGPNFGEVSANDKYLFLEKYINGSVNRFIFDCDQSSAANVYLECIINSNLKFKVDNDGAHYSAISALSSEEIKKNFEKLEDGLSIIKNVDIYKYHLKSQDDNEKKHIGFVIGDKYKYSEEITNEKNNGADIYSMIAVAYKAIQQQQETIEHLKEKIKALELRF